MAQDGDALPTVDEVHTVHKLIVDKYDLPEGTLLRKLNEELGDLIEDAAPDGEDDEYDVAARFLSRFLSRSPYRAGNIATGWLLTTIYLTRVGASIEPDVLKMAPYVVQSAPRYHLDELAEWLRTGNINTDPFEQEANAA